MKRRASDPRDQARRSALNALRRARRAAARAGVDLSQWEGDFLGSVEERIKTFGRAFGDPDKGAPGSALSMLQAVKLKEISAKAQSRPKPKQKSRPGPKGRRGLSRGDGRASEPDRHRED